MFKNQYNVFWLDIRTCVAQVACSDMVTFKHCTNNRFTNSTRTFEHKSAALQYNLFIATYMFKAN